MACMERTRGDALMWSAYRGTDNRPLAWKNGHINYRAQETSVNKIFGPFCDVIPVGRDVKIVVFIPSENIANQTDFLLFI